MLRPLLTIMFSLLVGSLFGQNVTILGQANDYAERSIRFYTYPEPVSHEPNSLAETVVRKDGTFELSFQVDQTIEIYAELEKFRGSMVVEPGATYRITLPPFTPRTLREAGSPYFEPELYWLGIKGAKPTELNFLVRNFLSDYNKELALHTIDLYRKKSVDSLKAIVARLERSYPSGRNTYFNTLKTYSYGKIEFSLQQQDKQQIEKKYFTKYEVHPAHPAYQHLFNAVYANYLTGKSQDIKKKEFFAPALKGNFRDFVNQLIRSGYAKDPAELVAVKSFYDGYFSNKLDKKLMLKGLKEATTQCSFEPLKYALPGILLKLTSLQEGTPAPALLLKSLMQESSGLKSNGKYIYLAFFKSKSTESVAELDSLVTIDKKLNSVLTIIPVSLDDNFLDAVQLWKQKKYPWELKSAADPAKASNDYRIKTTPVFYLLSPDLKLVLSPALSPTHNFESLFLKIYRENRFQQQKK